MERKVTRRLKSGRDDGRLGFGIRVDMEFLKRRCYALLLALFQHNSPTQISSYALLHACGNVHEEKACIVVAIASKVPIICCWSLRFRSSASKVPIVISGYAIGGGEDCGCREVRQDEGHQMSV